MKRFLKRVHFYASAISLMFFFILLYPWLYYYSRKPERYDRLNRVRRIFGFLSSAAVGIFYKYRYEKQIDWSQCYIVCPNHTSNLDITGMACLIPGNYAFLGKDTLLKNPVTAIFFKTIDIPFNRDSKISSFRAFKRAGEYLQQGISLVIFPEGKIPEHFPPSLDPFKNGPFRLAIELNIPILPVTITDAWKKVWDDGKTYGSRPGICDICVHKPIFTTGLTVDDADALRDRVHNIIDTEFKKK
ncbi:lysophospholipid acyltransferase family protein [Hufsiella ginkgonis]|uniref:1-acyl-sn-glycerol-3-phosphate acyltransferase n=1 Tax=Hufsiella ginkgonis TaxID=2695274 RepID=A0A7K1XX84_9SPHI|nr:lysophospholipid acyltransferase family protein [Hufsiella ginkgonis]MXV15552.1 1-acyl-sn-glycerol-3-phosphate acyltransferase [Hufsiella ginkgonis]